MYTCQKTIQVNLPWLGVPPNCQTKGQTVDRRRVPARVEVGNWKFGKPTTSNRKRVVILFFPFLPGAKPQKGFHSFHCVHTVQNTQDIQKMPSEVVESTSIPQKASDNKTRLRPPPGCCALWPPNRFFDMCTHHPRHAHPHTHSTRFSLPRTLSSPPNNIASSSILPSARALNVHSHSQSRAAAQEHATER